MDIYSLDDTLQGCYSVALATSAHKYKAAEWRCSILLKIWDNPLPYRQMKSPYVIM